MNTLLRLPLNKRAANLFAVSLLCMAVLFPTTALAQENTPDYRAIPTCPSTMKDNTPTECKHSDGSVTTCTRNNDGTTTTTQRTNYTCKNAAHGDVKESTTKCVYTAQTTAGNTTPKTSCTQTMADGTTTSTNSTGDDLGTNNTQECAADGTCESTNQGSGSNVVGSAVDNLLGGALTVVAFFILSFSSIFLGWIGSAFNWVVVNTIFQFGTYFGTSESMIVAWGVLRDVGNIILLFGFILMGVLTILNLHDYPVKKTIPGLIIFAVLLNFSLFASQAVIDVANAFSAIFYEQAGTQCADGIDIRECAQDDNSGISSRIIEQAGISTVFSITSENQAGSTPLGRAVVFLGLALFVTIAAIVLLAATILLVIRAVMLSFLMVVSPIGFAGMAIPPLKSLAKKWWHMLLSQAFFAPVFLLLIFVSLKLTTGLSAGVTDPNNGLANALAGGTFAGMGVIVTFMVVIGFLIASLVAAKSMGAVGASMATNAASAVVLGGMARTANFGLGGGAALARNLVQRSSFGDTRAAQVLTNRLLRPMENANMDVRRVPGMGALLGAAGISAGARPSEHATFGDMRHEYNDIVSGKAGKALEAQYLKERNDQKLEKAAHDSTDGTLPVEVQQYLGTLSTKELEELHGIKDGVAALAKNLSPEQFSKLMDSTALDAGQKGKLKAARFQDLSDLVKNKPAANASAADKQAYIDSVKGRLGEMTNKDLENLPSDILHPDNELALQALSDKQRDYLVDGGKITGVQVAAIKASYKHAQLAAKFKAAGGGAAGAAALNAHNGGLGGLTPAQVAKLGGEILQERAVARTLSPAMLKKLAAEDKLTRAQMQAIGAHLRSDSTQSREMKNYLRGAGGTLW